jgi:hypothetical protein
MIINFILNKTVVKIGEKNQSDKYLGTNKVFHKNLSRHLFTSVVHRSILHTSQTFVSKIW